MAALQPQLEKLNEHFVPQYFTFDTDLHELKKPAGLAAIAADGKATDIVTGVKKAFLHTTRDDAVAVLISDGNDNTSADVVGTLSAGLACEHGAGRLGLGRVGEHAQHRRGGRAGG